MGASLRAAGRAPHPGKADGEGPPPSWRERIAALRYVRPMLRLVWETHRGLASAMIALRLIRSAIPIAFLWTAKLVVDAVIAAQRNHGDTTRLWNLVAMELGIVLLGEMLARASGLVESLLGDLFSNAVSVRIMEHAATLDLAMFEDPTFYDHLERARRHTTGRIGMVAQVLGMLQDFLTLLSLLGALIAFSPVLLALLVAAVVPTFLSEARFAAMSYSLLYRWTPQRRVLDYVRYVGASNETAKEVQMFALAPWLIERFRALSTAFYDENRKLALRKAAVGIGVAAIGTLGYYGAYGVILLRTVAGGITIGTLTFLAGSFSRGRDIIQRVLLSASDIYEQSLYLRDLFVFLEMKPTIASIPDARPVPEPIRDGFEFRDVGFRYPGSERWAVRHLSFQLRAGERLALVGENGAGKTTITKLLARLYEPSEGLILLDGQDLRSYDLASLRRAIGVLFQDFVRYDMRFDENVGVGEITFSAPHLADGVEGEPPARLTEAARRSLAESLLPRLPGGYRQMLGRRFDGGVNLSGGEWQKVALARAYMRDAQVMILDEPTAALDARAEYEVFERFAQLMTGRTAVLVSHRFSTVRMADRILVLRAGELVQQGTHDELVTSNGLYAELFHMQAAGYR